MYNAYFVATSVAEKMRNPLEVQDIVERAVHRGEYTSNSWESHSFSDGLPGLAYFYSMLEQMLPGEGFDQPARQYMEHSIQAIQQRSQVNCSLFNGLSGLGMALTCTPDNERQYESLIAKLDDWLVKEVRRVFLDVSDQYLQEDKLIPASFYNLAEGLSGIIIYLLEREQAPHMKVFAEMCVKALAKMLLCQKQRGSRSVPAWYLLQEALSMEENPGPYVEGGFSSNMPFGLSGCLMALSLAALKGIRSDLLEKAVTDIASWLQERYRYILEEPYWNATLPMEEKPLVLPSQYELTHHSWMCGWPPVIRSLHLAGKASRSDSLEQFSREAFLNFTAGDEVPKLGGASFFAGISGFLTTYSPLVKEMDGKNGSAVLQSLEKKLMEFFDPQAPFGFRQFHMDQRGQFFEVDVPGLIHGASGIALSLLLTERGIPSFFYGKL